MGKLLTAAFLLLPLTSCETLGIGGTPIEPTENDRVITDAFFDYMTGQGKEEFWGVVSSEELLIRLMRGWQFAVIQSGDPEGIFLPAPTQ